MSPSRFGFAFLVVVFCPSAPLAAQDPWSKVPAFPTSCYDNGGFIELLSNLNHEVGTAGDRQGEVNSAIRQKIIDMDPSEKQSKMMAFMMKNPTEAQKMMQDIATAGQQGIKDTDRFIEKSQALDAALKSAEAQYDREMEPLRALQKQWGPTQPEHGYAGNPALGRQLAAKYDSDYELLCTKWLKTESSPLLKYLGNLKALHTTELIPAGVEKDRHMKRELELYGIPSTGLRSTEPEKAVGEYLNAMHTVFGRRESTTLISRSAK